MVFARMREVCFILRARAVIKFVLRAVSTLENIQLVSARSELRQAIFGKL